MMQSAVKSIDNAFAKVTTKIREVFRTSDFAFLQRAFRKEMTVVTNFLMIA